MNPNNKMTDNSLASNTIEIAIRLILILLIATLCFQIIKPFMIPVIWGAIIAVALFPLYQKLDSLFGQRSKLTTSLYVIAALSLLITPSIMLTASLVDTSTELAKNFSNGTLTIPRPEQNINDWPLVGNQIFNLWSQASSNLEDTLKQYVPEIKQAGETLLSAVAGVGGSIFQFIFSIIISGIFLLHAKNSYSITVKIASRLTDKQQGLQFANLAIATIRSVAQGVIGVAVIQATLGGLGMFLIGIPGWGLWTVLILILAVAQLPPLLILGPVIFYVFSIETSSSIAIIFTIWSVLVSMSDGFLKPLFLGRGMATPMLVILLGAIGGMMLFGILGLFIGAISLALGYELFIAWLDKEKELLDSDFQ